MKIKSFNSILLLALFQVLLLLILSVSCGDDNTSRKGMNLTGGKKKNISKKNQFGKKKDIPKPKTSKKSLNAKKPGKPQPKPDSNRNQNPPREVNQDKGGNPSTTPIVESPTEQPSEPPTPTETNNLELSPPQQSFPEMEETNESDEHSPPELVNTLEEESNEDFSPPPINPTEDPNEEIPETVPNTPPVSTITNPPKPKPSKPAPIQTTSLKVPNSNRKPRRKRPTTPAPENPETEKLNQGLLALFNLDNKIFGKKAGTFNNRHYVPLTSFREANSLIFTYLKTPIHTRSYYRSDYESNVLAIKKIAKNLSISTKTRMRIEEVALLIRMYNGIKQLYTRFVNKEGYINNIVDISKRINNVYYKMNFDDYAAFYHTPNKPVFYKQMVLPRSKKEIQENKEGKAKVLPDLELLYKTFVMARLLECFPQNKKNKISVNKAEKKVQEIIRQNWGSETLKKIKEETIPISLSFPH